METLKTWRHGLKNMDSDYGTFFLTNAVLITVSMSIGVWLGMQSNVTYREPTLIETCERIIRPEYHQQLCQEIYKQ